MNAYQIASLNLQEIVTWVTVAYTTISFMTFCLIGYGIWTMNRSNNRKSDALDELNERMFHADERRHKEATDRHEEAMAAHKQSMAAHKAAHEQSMAAHEQSMAAHKESMAAHMAAHEESMTALKELIANGEKTSKALVELLKRTEPLPAAPAAAD